MRAKKVRTGNSRNKAHDVFCLVAWLLGMFVAISSLVSCGPTRPAAVVRTDSVRVEIRERIVRDTAFFQIPSASASVVTRDTVSVLRNDYAESEAAIREGLLHHSLTTTGKTIRVPVYVQVHDTLVVRERGEKEFVEVPRQPTRWEAFLEVCGWILIALVSVVMVAFFIRLYLRSRCLR